MALYSLCPFHELFPEQGMNECRVLHVMRHERIPRDDYALVEYYCIDPGCDCRRVLLRAMSKATREYVAAISFAFDRRSKNAGPLLDPVNEQSSYARDLLNAVANVLSDPDYVARLEAHYRQVKRAIAAPTREVKDIMKRYKITRRPWLDN